MSEKESMTLEELRALKDMATDPRYTINLRALAKAVILLFERVNRMMPKKPIVDPLANALVVTRTDMTNPVKKKKPKPKLTLLKSKKESDVDE